ncbi:MAG: thiamine-phosphate kinase [Herminiimonas sp.]|nr:thiamine-phosphate kinase [Herminiimonas sp.]
MLSEFDLIASYFTRPHSGDVRIGLGIGDDCALLLPTAGMQLAISTDMLVEGRHFFAGTDAADLGHKALAVNLSDLAAMGATPLAFTLALSLPEASPDWLANFSRGLFALADLHGCNLIGGDTTRGPLNICITVFGELPAGAVLRRDAALPGDELWVSGTLGDARLALAALRNEDVLTASLTLSDAELQQASLRLHRPTPRVALGTALRGIAHAAIDISDGFDGDLAHVLARSRCGASVDVDALPAGPILQKMTPALRRDWCLAGGDDYELCFTAPLHQRAAVLAAGRASSTRVTRIGSIDAATGLRLLDAGGNVLQAPPSFDHFGKS